MNKKQNGLDEVKDLSWKLFSKTGDIRFYGAYKSAEELKNEKMLESEGSQPGM